LKIAIFKSYIFYLRLFQEPFCPTGFTLTFWFRALSFTVGTGHFNLIPQAQVAPKAGINLNTYDTTLRLYLNLFTRRFAAGIASSKCPVEQFNRRWHFIALTYDPATDKAYLRCNDIQIEISSSSTSSTGTGEFSFGSSYKFLLDEVFYVSTFSNEHVLKTIQNMS